MQLKQKPWESEVSYMYMAKKGLVINGGQTGPWDSEGRNRYRKETGPRLSCGGRSNRSLGRAR
jgi:hypothetical protein